MLSSGMFSCVRLRRSRLGVLRSAMLSSGRVCSGGHGDERFGIAWRFMVKAVKSGRR